MSINLFTRFVATGAFSGYAPVAPGSAGSLVGLALYLLLPVAPAHLWIAGLLFLFVVGVKVSSDAETVWGKDPGCVVIDEIVGFGVTVALLPRSVPLAVAGFLVFRVLDVLKPPPARQFERLPAGWGVMLDDIAVGLYGNLLLRIGLAMWHQV
ncbi:phosphatidylglycerophosphatase A [bacterium]|nr:phosphatidylglycerophosphatase A [bacterium]